MSGESNLKGNLVKVQTKSEYLSSRVCLSYIVPTHVTSLDNVAVNFYFCFYFYWRFLPVMLFKTLFRLGKISRMSRKCEKNRVQ